MAKTLIVASRVKELCQYNGKELNMSSDLVKRINEEVECMIDTACERCVENGRTTVMPRDF